MKLAIMQPYLFPYIGYFQLISSVDLFIVYDNIKYTKKGWINRNRILVNGSDHQFSIPIKNAPDSSMVVEREVAQNYCPKKLLNQFVGAYRKAPYFRETLPLLESVFFNPERNLFRFILYSIAATCSHLGISTEIRPSSSIPIDHNLRGKDKVMALCNNVGAKKYINPIGGMELYSPDAFRTGGIELKFLKPSPHEYLQLSPIFVPWLSIVDVLMFNKTSTINHNMLPNYELI